MAAAPMTTVTDKVKLEDDRVGIVKFVGEINKKEGFFFGVELSKGNGINSGNVGTVTYFPCKRNKGVFIKENKIARSKPVDDSAVPRLAYGSRVDVPDKGLGVVKYIGFPEFRQGQIFYGIELEEPNGKNDGKVNGKFYFRTAAGHGIFLPVAKIANCAILDGAPEEPMDEENKDNDDEAATEEAATEDPEPEPATEEPAADADDDGAATEEKEADEEEKGAEVYAMGDGVMVDDDKRGMVRFVGENKDTKKLGVGLWYGVRLLENRGNCDGTFKGIKFFKCPGGYGAMVQAKRITRRLNEDEMADMDFSQDDEPTEEELRRHEALEAARQKKLQMKAFRQKFKEIDTDGSMTIEMDEFERLMAETTGAGPEEAERLFYEIDITRSGAISLAEFDGWYQKQQGTTNIGADEEENQATAVISDALADELEEQVNDDVAEAEAEAAVEAAEAAEAEAEAEAEPANAGNE